MTMSGVLLGALGVLVLVSVGSFTNVIVSRLPVQLATPNEFGEAWSTRPWREVLGSTSRCDTCELAIAPWDNIPLLSYVLLRGKCRGCGSPIPRFHPVVELAVPALAIAVLLVNGLNAESLVLLLAVPSTVAVAAIDQRTMLVPTRLVWPTLGVVAVATVAVNLGNGRSHAILGCVVAALALAGPLALLWFVMPHALGFGDVRLSVLLGWLVGVAFAPVGWLDAVMLATIVLFLASLGTILAAVATGNVRRGSRLAFGPALIAATWMVVVCSQLFLTGPLAPVLTRGASA